MNAFDKVLDEEELSESETEVERDEDSRSKIENELENEESVKTNLIITHQYSTYKKLI